MKNILFFFFRCCCSLFIPFALSLSLHFVKCGCVSVYCYMFYFLWMFVFVCVRVCVCVCVGDHLVLFGQFFDISYSNCERLQAHIQHQHIISIVPYPAAVDPHSSKHTHTHSHKHTTKITEEIPYTHTYITKQIETYQNHCLIA